MGANDSFEATLHAIPSKGSDRETLFAMSGPVASSASPVPPKLSAFLEKGTLTQGLLDVALLTANVAQLKYVLSLGGSGANAHPFYVPILILLYLSIILQVSTGLCLLLLGKAQVSEDKTPGTPPELLNNLVTAQVFLITVINILISSFNIEETIQRSRRLDEWLSDDNNTNYLKQCDCIDPLRTFYLSQHQHHKTHCQ